MIREHFKSINRKKSIVVAKLALLLIVGAAFMTPVVAGWINPTPTKFLVAFDN